MRQFIQLRYSDRFGLTKSIVVGRMNRMGIRPSLRLQGPTMCLISNGAGSKRTPQVRQPNTRF